MGFKSLFLVFLFISSLASAQGKFLLVGGGGEKDTPWSWSNIPYSWAVEQAGNRSVAIISYAESSDPEWLPDYFKKLGAADAVNFIISSREIANDPEVNNQILNYDFVFFKGGDQSRYYELFNDTEFEQTVRSIHDRGGVIGGTSAGMAILSTPLFSAEEGSFYPDEALLSASPSTIVFKDDLLMFNPGFLFDTHFIERGRHARMLSFLGNLFLDGQDVPIGIGVDDQTAFCIDASGNGTAWGTGAVSVFSLENFESVSGKPAGKTMLSQLLHGDGINLNTLALDADYGISSLPENTNTSGKYELFLAASGELNANRQWLISELSNNEKITIIARENSNDASNYRSFLQESGYTVQIVSTDIKDDCSRASDINFLLSSTAIFWIDNDWDDLNLFFEEDPAGRKLGELKFSDDLKHFLFGDNVDFAGKQFALNRLGDGFNSYYGELEFEAGLSLAGDMMLVSEAYDPSSTTFYENNTASLLYGLINYAAEYGLWLNEASYAHIYNQDGSRLLEVTGKYSGMIAVNPGTDASNASQPVNEAGDSRQVTGFERMEIYMTADVPFHLSDAYSASGYLPQFVPEPVSEPEYELLESGFRLSWSYEGPVTPDIFRIEYSDGDDLVLINEVDGNERSVLVNDGKPGEYVITAIVASGEGCSVSLQVDAVTSVIPELTDYLFFPNPSSGFINVSRRKGLSATELVLIDLSGRALFRQELTNGQGQIELSGIPDGTYIIEFRSPDRTLRQKIIIRGKAP